MTILDKLRIPVEKDAEMPSEFRDELDDDFPHENSDRIDYGIADDDPRRDPSPGEPAKRETGRGARTVRAEVPRVTKKHREDAAEEIATFIEMIALAWSWQAPPCGDALEAAAPDIAAKVTRLLARNPRWLLRVREGGMLADAVGIAIAFKPVVQVAWTHYSAPAPGGDQHVFDPAAFPAYDGTGLHRG